MLVALGLTWAMSTANGEDSINLDAANDNTLKDNKANGNGPDGIHASSDSANNTIQSNNAMWTRCSTAMISPSVHASQAPPTSG